MLSTRKQREGSAGCLEMTARGRKLFGRDDKDDRDADQLGLTRDKSERGEGESQVKQELEDCV